MKVLRDKLDSKLKEMLETETAKAVGLSQVPSNIPDMNEGYIVIFWSPSPMPEGSWGDPEDCRYLDYQLKSVGRSHRQVARISSMIQGAMTDRAAGGFATSIAVSGLAIIDRSTVSNGMIRVSGDGLFETDDIYRLAVTSA